ncbi:MAG: sulfatase family protein [Bacteroidales bacterium]
MNKLLLFLPVFVVLLQGCTKDKKSESTEFPNIIFILADDMGYGDVSCLNEDAKVSTPNLDKLASEGMIFHDAHSGSAVCTPTRYGILTGRYCWRSRLKRGVLSPWDEPLIESERLTVGDMLKSKGYTTACIGKWHLGWQWATTDGSRIADMAEDGKTPDKAQRQEFGEKVDFTKPVAEGPLTRGFDYYFGDDVPNYPPYCFIENDKTVGSLNQTKPDSMFGHPGPMVEGWKLEDVMPILTHRTVDYISNKGKVFKREKGKPFFLYFPLTAPHTPIAPAKEFQGTSTAGAYGDYVQQVDWTVGQVLKALEREGLADNTLIIFTSDNGSPARSGENMLGGLRSVLKYGHNPSYHFTGIKADIYEGGHHVPFIAKWAGEIKAGSVSEETICHTDFMATCAAIVGYDLPDNAAEDSYNLLPILEGQNFTSPLREATVHHSAQGQFAIRQGEWKLILGGGSGGWTSPTNDKQAEKQGLPLMQLYKVNGDVGEKENLYEQNPEVVEQMTVLLEQYKTEGRSAPR